MDTLRKQAVECDFVRFTVADFHGISRGRYIPRSSVAQVLEDGLGLFCDIIGIGPRCQLVVREKTSHGGNVTLSPMPDTFRVLPWAGAGKSKVGEVLCETLWSSDEPQEACPRYVARKQVERLAKRYHGTTLRSGWEEEFILLHQDTQEPVYKGCDALSHLLFAEQEGFYLELQKMLETGGVKLEGMNNEYASGQLEVVTKPVSGIRGVDAAFNLKEAVKEISAQKGFQAVFMAKPYPEISGSGLHYNFSLKDQKGANVFYDGASNDKLSEFAHFFIGGLIVHAKAIAALCCPTINCYRRLHKPWAPGQIVWGIDDRRSYLRVKFGSSGPYMENRLPSAAANPYLVVAATIAAGLDGVAKKIKPPPAMDQTPEEFPRSLQEALQALQEDTVLAEALGLEFVDWFLVTKRGIECEELKSSDMSKPTEEDLKKEHEMYAKFI